MTDVVITGYKSGIGKSLYNLFSKNNYKCIGIDLQDGVDLRTTSGIKFTVEQCKNATVFINNAFPNQPLLFEEVYKIWKNEKKVIINISSAVTYIYKLETLPLDIIDSDYYIHKLELNQAVESVKYNRLPYVMNIRPGWVDTPLSANVTSKKMNPDDLAELIFFNFVNRSKYQIIDIVLR
jgi:hypothetical protein